MVLDFQKERAFIFGNRFTGKKGASGLRRRFSDEKKARSIIEKREELNRIKRLIKKADDRKRDRFAGVKKKLSSPGFTFRSALGFGRSDTLSESAELRKRLRELKKRR